jgi:hypothetical protein
LYNIPTVQKGIQSRTVYIKKARVLQTRNIQIVENNIKPRYTTALYKSRKSRKSTRSILIDSVYTKLPKALYLLVLYLPTQLLLLAQDCLDNIQQADLQAQRIKDLVQTYLLVVAILLSKLVSQGFSKTCLYQA